jgi:hypothetical protein
MSTLAHTLTDPFTGTWRFNSKLSKLSMPSPRSWVQEIVSTLGEIEVREDLVTANGSRSLVHLKAKLDGKDHPVEGSSAADTMAYTRTSSNSISGTGKKSGVLSLKETLTASPQDGTLTVNFLIYAGAEVVGKGTAVFEKDP